MQSMNDTINDSSMNGTMNQRGLFMKNKNRPVTAAGGGAHRRGVLARATLYSSTEISKFATEIAILYYISSTKDILRTQ